MLIQKNRPQNSPEEKEKTKVSEKGTKITVKTEAMGSTSKSFKERPIEKLDEVSNREYEIVRMDIEPEYED